VLSPKSSLITLNAGTFTDNERGLWLPVLVGSRIYSAYSGNFSDLVERLAGVVDASLRAKQLNEAMVLLDKIGPVDAQGKTQEGDFDTLNNREGYIEYAIAVLYGVDFLPKLFAGGFGTEGGAAETVVRW
jgi:hypothetical protein